ncbi:MAG: bifunctional DNA-formamidopyrimidine glycosylase/DNA-(apurinic or apyrimidinic site) lyase [Patescibacteria group bacterium]|jgi:formamidopyrimidine-DNA glycosylase
MPELPEIETIKKGLAKKIIGKEIVDIKIETTKSFQGDKENILGAKIEEIGRRAKLISMKLSNGFNLLFHLKLTGQLIYVENGERMAGGHPSHDWHAKLPNTNTRLIFTFKNGSKLFFNDLRKFGWCKVLTDIELREIFEGYGVEPFTSDFTVDYLLRKAKKIPNRNIKQFLTDQEIIAGIGNIYVDESLFLAGVLPTRKLRDLSMAEWQKINVSVLKVLKLGLKYGGTSDRDYVNALGVKGGMQNYLKVYHRVGQPCLGGCGGVVKRMTIGGRGTHYCPTCQK